MWDATKVADWQEEYKRRFISAEEAAEMVKPGNYVGFTLGREAQSIGLALAVRKEELKDVKVFVPFPGFDFGWYDAGWEDSFSVTMLMPTGTSQQMIDDRRGDIEVGDAFASTLSQQRTADVIFTEISTPDIRGYSSFGQSLWSKKSHIKNAKLVIAEVNERLIRTYGENYVHVSEIDYFVEHPASGAVPGTGSLAGRAKKEPEPFLKDIAANVAELIRDGDTIQIGVGRATEPLIRLGILDNKNDIGFHSEATPPGVIPLVRSGVVNGKRKTINQGKVLVTALGGDTRENMEWAAENPLFWLMPVEYVWDVRVISAHDNMVAINNALQLDLTGQIAAETVGTKMWANAGGQTVFAVGSQVSRGGRCITVLPSTAGDGKISRIVSLFEPGTIVTVPRNMADNVVTEYGIARLRGKSLRQRAEELIAVAHPDFRAELKKEARRLFWP
jgi:4-hydroxybutyrate CoA-transferase